MSERAGALLETVTEQVDTTAAPLGFDEAFTLHHRAVFRTARAIVRDSALAEDVTQEVFLRLYRNMDATPGEELLRAWLLRVAMNVARNTLRGQSRAVAREELYAQDAERTGWFAPAPEEELERRSEIEEARRTLDKIKEPMRSCLLLKQQGLSYKEIATSLQINEGNVGSLIARGRKEFVRLYGKIGGNR
ncbi:MAG TPA: sigma-70 family RNA polymerase sigma factor [Pyrinomonadaceae bacterium]|nr:sigma-70 family RNA polymerase sigma factor [Pyrinomonadaceae bacterium]